MKISLKGISKAFLSNEIFNGAEYPEKSQGYWESLGREKVL